MALTVLPKNQSLGELLGTGLGAGLSQGMQQAGQQYQQQAGLGQLLNMLNIPQGQSKQLSSALANLDPKLQQTILANIGTLAASQQPGMQPDQMGQPGQVQEQGVGQERSVLNKLFTTPQQQQMEERLKLKKQQTELQEQAQTFKQFEAQKGTIEKYGRPANQLLSSVDRALEILEKGNPITGLAGGILSPKFQTAEGQELGQIFNEIVLLKDSQLPGRNSALRLSLQQLSKPQIWQSTQALTSLLKRMRANPAALEDAARYNALQKLEEDFTDKVPKDWRQQLGKKTKQMRLKRLDLPDVGDYQDNTILRNPETNQRVKKIDGAWREIS